MKCPDCGKNLIDVATACRCGWIKEASGTKAARPSCACGAPATIRKDDKNQCEACYVAVATASAREYVTGLGLDRRADETPAEQRMRLMAYIRERAKPKSFADASVAEDEWAG